MGFYTSHGEEQDLTSMLFSFGAKARGCRYGGSGDAHDIEVHNEGPVCCTSLNSSWWLTTPYVTVVSVMVMSLSLQVLEILCQCRC